MHNRYRAVTIDDQPDLLLRIDQLGRQSFPRFLFEGDSVFNAGWDRILKEFPVCQFALFEGEEMVGGGITVPLYWDGTMEGLPNVIDELFPTDQKEPNVLCAIAGLVVEQHQGKGISRDILVTMKRIAEKLRFRSLLAPVRPNWKEKYPLTPIEDYMHWKREDGLAYDPWIRVHQRLEAPLLRVMPKCIVSTATIQQWQEWTGLRFFQSGSYVVPGALNTVEINAEEDRGTYIEPAVWMEHTVRNG
ncbi:hypothetical protein [Desmospora activa]|uniref:Acetyltransferase (GNAT) family protein n=1 Tax=Desmospora activa DSM 45169 TaxID=1121389 RepID=A0A2T4Z6W8_9BACL|nr:hypothetical protein [Desmospora activa]PTM57639.1 hypothetical protein C8J48_0189 [Desmospora activa DSM 45169]